MITSNVTALHGDPENSPCNCPIILRATSWPSMFLGPSAALNRDSTPTAGLVNTP